MVMKNFKEHVCAFLNKHGESIENANWAGFVGYGKFETIDEFLEFCDFEYEEDMYDLMPEFSRFDDIIEQLVIVGDDWWVEIYTYDGLNYLDFKKSPDKPKLFV